MANIKNMNKKHIERGDILYVSDTGCEIGHEMRKTRPCIVVSNNKCNRSSTCIEIVHITSSTSKSNIPTHVEICYCGVYGTVLCESITTVDKSRIKEYLGKCTKNDMNRIDEALAISLDLNTKTDVKNNVKADVKNTRMSFVMGDNEILTNAADVIRIINELCTRINEAEGLINSDYKYENDVLGKVLPQNKLDELWLLTMIKVEEEKKEAERRLKAIIDSANGKSVYISEDESNEKCDTCKKKSNKKEMLPKEIRDKIYHMIEDGYSNKEIIEKIGITSVRVSDYRHYYNKYIKGKGRKIEDLNDYSGRLSKETRDKIYDMLVNGYNNSEIGEKFGLTNSQVSLYRTRARKKGLIK